MKKIEELPDLKPFFEFRRLEEEKKSNRDADQNSEPVHLATDEPDFTYGK